MYTHKVHYYETDKMGITHHSNYIRWMEEARIDFFEKLDLGYDKMEEQGMMSPVLSVNGNYKKTTTFADIINIEVKIAEFNGVKLKLSYTMTNVDGAVVFTGESSHCFLNESGYPVKLKKDKPEIYSALMNAMEGEE